MRASRRSGANSTLNKATVPLLPKNRLIKELQERGLDCSGVQTVLASRLLDFLCNEDGSAPTVTTTPVAPVVKKSAPASKKTPAPKTPKTPKSASRQPPGRRSLRGAKNVKEEEPDEEQEEEEEVQNDESEVDEPAVEEEPPVEVPKPKKASAANGRRSIKQEPPEEEPETVDALEEVSATTPVARRTYKKQNKENTTPAAKKTAKQKAKPSVKVEEPDAPEEPSEDQPSTSEPVSATPTTKKTTKAASQTPKSDEKRSRRKSARLLASEQMEEIDDEEEVPAEDVPEEPKVVPEEAVTEAVPEATGPSEPAKKKQKVVTVKEEPVDETETIVEPSKKVKKSIKQEVIDSADDSANSDQDYHPQEESQEPTRHSKRIKEHIESGTHLDVFQVIQREKAERAEKLEKIKKSRPSTSSQPTPAPKQANWQVEWAAKMAMHKNAQKPTTPAPAADSSKRKESGEKSAIDPSKKKKTVAIDAIEALMTSTIKEKVEKKTSTEQRPDRIVGGADSTHDYSKNISMASPQLSAKTPTQYPTGLFFNQPAQPPPKQPLPSVSGFPAMIPHPMGPMIPVPPLPTRVHLPPPPVPPPVFPVASSGRRRQSRFDQPPADQPTTQHYYAKANAPPPTLTTAIQIGRPSKVLSPPPPPPPRKRPLTDDIPPPPPKPKLVVPPTSDLRRRVEELFSSEPSAPVPVVFSPRESSSSVASIPPPPPPPPLAPKSVSVKQEPEEPQPVEQEVEDDDDDDFVIRETFVESSEPPAKIMKVEPRASSPDPIVQRVLAHIEEEDNAPKAINKVEEARKREALAEERRRRAMELGDGEYDPGDDTKVDESEMVYEYQPTTAKGDDEEMEDEDDDDEMYVDDEGVEEEEEEDDEDEEEQEKEKEAVEEEEMDDPIAINQNPMELLKRALPFLHSSTVAEAPKNDYAQLNVPASESLLVRHEDEKPEEVYYHGDPVPEVDENELYEIAAGIKPKKKEKKALVQIPEEERVPTDPETIELDYYNADILVKSAEKNIWQIEPFNQDGLALMWGGVRSNFGIQLPFKRTDKDAAHRIGFQIQIESYQSIQHLPTEFMSDGGDVRVGFSLAASKLILGEYSGSWCISATGKRAMNNQFSEFGQSFQIGDVVTCILDLQERSISYKINGEDVGTPFEKIPFREGDIIFPTICTKNANINVNLGQDLSDEKWNIPEDRDWMFITEMDRTHLIRSTVAPASKRDCTVLMTVGLPGVGKTTWVRRYLIEHPHEHWTLISADVVMDAMKVNGVHRIRLPNLKRPDFLRGIIGKSMARLILLAPRRRKNYILDMTNCFADKRKRKLMAFEDFNRKCMIFVPDEDVHQKRLIKQEHEENEKLDTDAMMQHKAAMSLPIVGEGEPCDELIFVDPKDEDQQLAFDRVAKMNYECRSWLVVPGRRRGGYHNNHNRGNYQHHHQHDHHGGGYHQHQYNRPSTSGPPSGGMSNQYSPRTSVSAINITHTTFQSSTTPAVPSPLVRDEGPIILPPVKISLPTTSPALDSPRTTNQFSFPPPSIAQQSPAPVPQPLKDLQTQQQQVQQQIQQKVQQVQQAQKKVEVSQPLSLNTSLPRKSVDIAGPSSALSSAGRSSSFSQNSPRFGFSTSKESTPIPTTSVPTPMVHTPVVPVMNITQPPPQMLMSVPPPIMAQMRQPPPIVFPIDVTVPPPNFSAPPPPIPAPSPVSAIPPHLMAFHQQQMSTPPPSTSSPFTYPPPQFAPR